MTPSILQRIFRRTAQPSAARSRAPWKAIAASAALALAATSAGATIVAVVPDVVLSTPDSVVLGDERSNIHLIAFDEAQCVPLPFDVTTDQGVIPMGTSVRSHFIHGDPITTFMLTGRVTFGTNILGVISTRAGLDATDCRLGKFGVDYPNCPLAGAAVPEPLRGLEPQDSYVIGAAGRTIEVTMQANVGSDQIRVVTACPCP